MSVSKSLKALLFNYHGCSFNRTAHQNPCFTVHRFRLVIKLNLPFTMRSGIVSTVTYFSTDAQVHVLNALVVLWLSSLPEPVVHFGLMAWLHRIQEMSQPVPVSILAIHLCANGDYYCFCWFGLLFHNYQPNI